MSTIFDKFCETFSLNPYEAEIFIKTAPERYKLHSISKRHGGIRYIHQPTKNLKFIQRWLVNSYFSSMPIHSCAHAYVKNRNILSNAKPHSHNKYLMKLDFSDFFTSITIRGFLIFAHDNLREFSYEEHHILASLLFCRHKINGDFVLSIGAPSSPIISNIMLYRFDQVLYDFCRTKYVYYTRYADDLSFSTNQPRILKEEVFPFVEGLCKTIPYPNYLKLNKNKVVHVSKKFNRRITGLVLSNEGNISIGRDKKRQLRAMAHQMSLNKLPPEKINKLLGYINFLKGKIDPEFAEQLIQKLNNKHNK